ncbi:MAG TPA: histidine kinase [Candidatus Polarisedimenticolia bacterium]|nr:histidine kinase [Candidatus Polarisedimenticolia bacterium]
MNLIRLTELLIYTYGAFCYGAILLLWGREMGQVNYAGRAARPAAPRDGSSLVVGSITLVSLLWFVTNLLMVLAELQPGIRLYPLRSILLTLAFLFPPLIAHTTFVEICADAPGRVGPPWRHLLRVFYFVSLMCIVVSMLGFWGVVELPRDTLGWASGVALGVLFSLAGLYSVTAISRHSPRPRSSSERNIRRVWLVLFSLLFLMGLPIIFTNAGWIPMTVLLRLVIQSAPLLFLFAGTYFDNRFEFFDLFVKRGMAFLVTLVFLTAYFAVVPPRLARLSLAWASPWVHALTLLPVVLTLPAIYHGISRWLDNVWLGRQFSGAEAVKHFLAGIQSATEEESLVREAESRLQEIFHAPARVLLGDATAQRSDEAGACAKEADLEISIGRGADRAGVIRLGRRATQIPFFSQDVELLESLAEVFVSMLENVRLQHRRLEQEQREQALSLHASRSELKALRAQINPHFLFNALNAIAGLIPKDPRRADRAVEQLAEVFRYTLRRSESDWSRLEEEIDAVRAYLDLEQARFGARLQCRIQVDPAVRDARIPTLVVQTLVENAVKHGVAAIRGAGIIEVEALRKSDALEIRVLDNGPGFTEESAGAGGEPKGSSSGFGLRNVRERLTGYFGEKASLHIGRDAARGLTVVSLLLPWGSGPTAPADPVHAAALVKEPAP